MNIIETLLSCFQHFWSHPLRTILTLLGIIIGVASLLSMIGIGEGTRQRVVQDMERLGGAGLIIIHPPEPRHDETAVNLIKHVLTHQDLQAFKNASNFIEIITPIIALKKNFSFQQKLYNSVCYGIAPEYSKIRGWSLAKGRFILNSDIELKKKVCVIGSEIKDQLFKNVNPVGKLMRIGTEEYTVVGLMDLRDFEGGRWMNHLVLIPISTMETRLFKPNHLNKILVKVKSTAVLHVVKRQIQRVLQGRYRYAKKFNIFSQEDVIRSVNKSTRLLRLSQFISASIVILVGGIGIMNLMLVSVTERTKEIGLRKAVGATNMDILRQFLLEAVIISMVGGIIGIILGLKIGDLSSEFITYFLHDNIQSIVSIKAIGLAVVFVFLVGVFFGLYPAVRAARLDPSKALSYE
ncbi:MAG: ABC transporter permease [Desulfobacterales bacterium]